MKKLFLISCLFTSLFALKAFADNGIECFSKTFVYNDDGTVSVVATTDWDTTIEGVYNSKEEAYMAVYGFIPAISWEAGGFDAYFNVNYPTGQTPLNNNGSVKQRGRLIYTVKEATEVTKDTGNKVRIRYK